MGGSSRPVVRAPCAAVIPDPADHVTGMDRLTDADPQFGMVYFSRDPQPADRAPENENRPRIANVHGAARRAGFPAWDRSNHLRRLPGHVSDELNRSSPGSADIDGVVVLAEETGAPGTGHVVPDAAVCASQRKIPRPPPPLQNTRAEQAVSPAGSGAGGHCAARSRRIAGVRAFKRMRLRRAQKAWSPAQTFKWSIPGAGD
jgi:hypothetical protein